MPIAFQGFVVLSSPCRIYPCHLGHTWEISFEVFQGILEWCVMKCSKKQLLVSFRRSILKYSQKTPEHLVLWSGFQDTPNRSVFKCCKIFIQKYLLHFPHSTSLPCSFLFPSRIYNSFKYL